MPRGPGPAGLNQRIAGVFAGLFGRKGPTASGGASQQAARSAADLAKALRKQSREEARQRQLSAKPSMQITVTTGQQRFTPGSGQQQSLGQRQAYEYEQARESQNFLQEQRSFVVAPQRQHRSKAGFHA